VLHVQCKRVASFPHHTAVTLWMGSKCTK
jgi:hypothetical protein